MRSIIEWLFNLDPKVVGPDAELSLRFNESLEGWQVFLLTLGVIAFAVWIYRRDGRGTASPFFRTFLGVLRASLIAMAIFILAEPILLATHVETRRSVALVLVDDSFSMELKFADAEETLRKKLQAAMGSAKVTLINPDGKEEKIDAQKLDASHFKLISRLNVVSSALSVPLNGKTFLDVLKEKHDVRFYTFSRSVSASGDDNKPLNPQKLEASNKRGGETRIGDCLRAGLKELRGQPLAGVVIISDGRQNAGEDAVQAAQLCKTQKVPLFTVGIGDPSEPKDFEISVDGPDAILPDDPTDVTPMIRFKGYTGIDAIKVTMKSGEKVIGTEDVKLGKPGEKLTVSMRVKESKPGKYSYVFSIPEHPGELRTDNNTATYNFQVIDKKVKVLFVEGQDLPRWEYRYLKNALRRDHTTEVDVLLATGDGSFLWDGTDGKTPLDQFPINKKQISDYDVIIFGDVNPTIFTTEQVNLVRDFVREGGGFIMIAGERYAPVEYGQGAWYEMLPIVPTRGYQPPADGFQESFSVELTPDGRKQPWTYMDADENANKEVWSNLPQLYWYFPIKRKKENATTVAVHPTAKDEQGGKMPLIVTMQYGSGKTMFIGVDSLWRWRRSVGDRYHYRFYNQAIRHLSMAKRLGGQKRFYLGIDRSAVAIGDRLVVSAVVKDENLKDSTVDKVLAYGKTPKGEDFTVELTRLRDRPGHYEGNFFPVVTGDYSIWLRDDSQPELRQSEVAFKAEKPQLEFENPRLDKELLENIARAGGDGGAYFEIDKLSEIPAKINPIKLEIPRETPISLWDNKYVFILFTILITLEWVLRKRGRMI